MKHPGQVRQNNNLRLFNNSFLERVKAVTYLDPRLHGDDGRSLTVVIPAKLVPDLDRGAVI